MNIRSLDPISYRPKPDEPWQKAIVISYAKDFLALCLEVNSAARFSREVIALDLTFDEQWQLIGPPF